MYYVVMSDSRLSLIGESPGSNPPHAPLSAAAPQWTGRRMARILGLDWRDYEARVCRLNMSDVPGEVPVFDPLDTGRERRLRVYATGIRRATVFLGQAAALAYNPLAPWEWFTPLHVRLPGVSSDLYMRAVMIPHPSGTSRVYNDPDMVRAARDVVWSEVARAAEKSV